jgi:hypothetical protein
VIEQNTFKLKGVKNEKLSFHKSIAGLFAVLDSAFGWLLHQHRKLRYAGKIPKNGAVISASVAGLNLCSPDPQWLNYNEWRRRCRL